MLDHAVADTREILQLFRVLCQLFDRVWQPRNELGRLFVAAIAADDGSVDFQELRGFPQDTSYLLVVHGVIIMRTRFESNPWLAGWAEKEPAEEGPLPAT